MIILDKIIEYINKLYDPLSIIVYGSYANGTNDLNSDFDALVISKSHKRFHDTSSLNGLKLDVFVYPCSYFDGEYDCGDFIQIFDGKIIEDKNGIGKKLKNRVSSYIEDRPRKSYEENQANIDWCVKMAERAKRNDAEGLYRWHWVLTDSLEIFCDVMDHPYFGPKKSLNWMRENQPEAFLHYEKALNDFTVESLSNWIAYLKKINL